MTKNTIVTPEHLQWAAASAKRETESLAFLVMGIDIVAMNNPVRVLSYPADSWAWEHGMMCQFKNQNFEVIGIEHDPAVHAQAVLHAPRIGICTMFTSPMSFDQYLLTNPDPFDIINLDWKGSWCEEKKRDLKAMFSGTSLLRRGGLLLLSLPLTPDSPKTTSELYDWANNSIGFSVYGGPRRDENTSALKTRGIPDWIIGAAEDCGVELRALVTGVSYSSYNGADAPGPVVQFVFKRIG